MKRVNTHLSVNDVPKRGDINKHRGSLFIHPWVLDKQRHLLNQREKYLPNNMIKISFVDRP